MLENLLTEQVNPASAHLDALPTEEMLRVINAEDGKVAARWSARFRSIARAVDAIVAAIERGGRLFYIGAGTSGRLGVLDASEIPPTFSAPPSMVQGIIAGGEAALSRATETTEDDPAIGVRDLVARGFTANDVLVGIAASGRTPYVLGAVAEARRLGAVTVGISCTPDSELARAVDIAITPLVGPEVVAGSTRMKAGTAQKLVLNMLSTGACVRLGYVYGNLMVNVQPKNAKLVDRARRIVAQAAGVSYERAGELLEESGSSVRTAIVMAKAGIGREEAERRLAAAGGGIAQACSAKALVTEKHMDKFVVTGGTALHGEIPTNGSKNSALPALAAALLTRRSGHAAPHSAGARHPHHAAAAGGYRLAGGHRWLHGAARNAAHCRAPRRRTSW